MYSTQCFIPGEWSYPKATQLNAITLKPVQCGQPKVTLLGPKVHVFIH